MPNTTNYNLNIYNASDTTTTFYEFRLGIAGTADTSNFVVIDGLLKQNADAHSDIRQAVAGKASPSDVDTKISTHNTASGAHSALFNQKAAAADLTSHTNNTTVHVTATERTAWNNKVDKATGTLSFTLGRDADGIYVEY